MKGVSIMNKQIKMGAQIEIKNGQHKGEKGIYIGWDHLGQKHNVILYWQDGSIQGHYGFGISAIRVLHESDIW